MGKKLKYYLGFWMLEKDVEDITLEFCEIWNFLTLRKITRFDWAFVTNTFSATLASSDLSEDAVGKPGKINSFKGFESKDNTLFCTPLINI